jgi:hypothetical protein
MHSIISVRSFFLNILLGDYSTRIWGTRTSINNASYQHENSYTLATGPGTGPPNFPPSLSRWDSRKELWPLSKPELYDPGADGILLWVSISCHQIALRPEYFPTGLSLFFRDMKSKSIPGWCAASHEAD